MTSTIPLQLFDHTKNPVTFDQYQDLEPKIAAHLVQIPSNLKTQRILRRKFNMLYQTAEAYRYATLLYLHQAVPEIPSMYCAQLADKVFKCLA